MRVGLPSLRWAAARAWSGSRPRARFSCTSASRYASNSRARSWSHAARCRNLGHFISLFLGWLGPQHPIDGAYHLLPAAGLLNQLFPPLRRQAVVARLAIVFRGTPEGCDPAAIF